MGFSGSFGVTPFVGMAELNDTEGGLLPETEDGPKEAGTTRFGGLGGEEGGIACKTYNQTLAQDSRIVKAHLRFSQWLI